MRSTWFAPLVLALAILLGGSTASAQVPVGAGASGTTVPEFRLGFKTLAGLIPEVVGQPVEEERHGANGDSLQRTARGLMVWRKADNWTAFTDGATTWINGPSGVQSRSNGDRFAWEAPADSVSWDPSELSMWDRRSSPIAYIATQEENTIYLWSGEPVAYLLENHLYGFNGRHLGWFQDGILWDWEGVAIGFTRQAPYVAQNSEPPKPAKSPRPARLPREAAPPQPPLTLGVFTELLVHTLLRGR